MQRKKTFDSFRRCKVVILSVLMSFCMTAAFAQSGAVKGKVLDELGEPIIGANIVEKGTPMVLSLTWTVTTALP